MVQDINEEPLTVDALSRLCLRRIVKENHGTPIVQACFPPLPISPDTMIDMTNILATISGSQVNLYDNEHCGDHLDILSTFECPTAPEHKVIICSYLSITPINITNNESYSAAAGLNSQMMRISARVEQTK